MSLLKSDPWRRQQQSFLVRCKPEYFPNNKNQGVLPQPDHYRQKLRTCRNYSPLTRSRQGQSNKENQKSAQIGQQTCSYNFAYNPLKRSSYIPYDLSKSRQSASKRDKKQALALQFQEQCNPLIRQTEPKQLNKQSGRHRQSSLKYQPYQQYQNANKVNQLQLAIQQSQLSQTYRASRRMNQKYVSPVSLQQGSALGITFSNQNGTGNKCRTPPKNGLQSEKLVQKAEFLRQRIQRINRMTPRGSKAKQQVNVHTGMSIIQSVTPQKQTTTPASSGGVFLKQSYEGGIVKYNRYCDEKLPLQTIYDAEQHRFECSWREADYETEAGLAKINKLSEKINQRLCAIINKHGK